MRRNTLQIKLAVVFVVTLLLAPLAALHAADATKPAAKPNILWIIMDDVGAELPCYGEKNPLSPPSSLRRGYDRQAGPTHWLFQEPPAESKFLPASQRLVELALVGS